MATGWEYFNLQLVTFDRLAGLNISEEKYRKLSTMLSSDNIADFNLAVEIINNLYDTERPGEQNRSRLD